jgi:hypothetical protein
MIRASAQRLMARLGPEIAGVALPRELFYVRGAVRPSATLLNRKAPVERPKQLEGAELFMDSATARQIYGAEAKPLPLDFWAPGNDFFAGTDPFPSSGSREAELMKGSL